MGFPGQQSSMDHKYHTHKRAMGFNQLLKSFTMPVPVAIKISWQLEALSSSAGTKETYRVPKGHMGKVVRTDLILMDLDFLR